MNTSTSKKPSPLNPNTGSSAKKSVIQELHTYRGTPRFEDAVISAMFGISVALGSISRSHEVLLDKIESIARKVEDLKKEVTSLRMPPPPPPTPVPEMISEENLDLPSEQEMMDYINSLQTMLEFGTSPDITCYETL